MMYSKKNMMLVSVNCLIAGQASEVPFSIPIGEEITVGGVDISFDALTVSMFKEVIFNKNPNVRSAIQNMVLYKVDLGFEDLENKIYTKDEIEGGIGEMMKPMSDFKDYFNNKDKVPVRKRLHIFIVIPEQPIGVRTLAGSKENLYIFIDDSNLYIEGKYVVGEYENMGVFDHRRRQYRFDQLRIDYGQILRTVQNGRTLGGDPIVVGSIPPADSLWDLVRDEGFKVTTFLRDARGFEKMVDMQIGHYIDQVLYNKVPAVLALIAGDSDFKPVLQTAVKLGWMVEIYFWNTEIFAMNELSIADKLELLCEKNTLGLSFQLFDPENKNNPVFVSLNPFYKTITYGYGPEILYYGCGQMKLLQLSGKGISNWRINDMMDFFDELGIFGWWYRVRDLIWFYFKNLNDKREAENLIRKKYPQINFQ